MNLDRFSLDENWLKCLDAETVQSRRAIQQHRMLANHFFQNVPNDGLLSLNHLARLFDRRRVCLLFELVVDERLEEFERHLFWQTALMQFQLRTDNDH